MFIFPEDDSQAIHFGDHVRLHPALTTPEDRTYAVGDVIECLGEEMIPGIRNEVFAIILPFLVLYFRISSIILVIEHVLPAIYRTTGFLFIVACCLTISSSTQLCRLLVHKHFSRWNVLQHLTLG